MGVNESKSRQTISEPNPEQIIKAALYASGRPLSVDILSKLVGLPSTEVHKIVRAIKKEFDKSNDFLEIVISPGPTYLMQLRPHLVKYVKQLSPQPLLTVAELKTLALIAIKQPVFQSTIAKIRGTQAYEHISKLIELGFVSAERQGRTKVLVTTKRFSEYFGLPLDKKSLKLKLLSLVRNFDSKRIKSDTLEDLIRQSTQQINNNTE